MTTLAPALTGHRSPTSGPALPGQRGPLSTAVLDVLSEASAAADLPLIHGVDPYWEVDPYGEDLQLALYVAYELHYRSFAGVDDDLEWDADLLRFRSGLEARFLAALRADAADPAGDVQAALDALLVTPTSGTGPSWHLARNGERWQLHEYVAHRSLYHLKEADPQAWVIPRLDGAAKAAMVTIEHDEYGGGRSERLHATLFAAMMANLGLDPAYGFYLDVVPAATLATVNAMSMFGLHRSLRGALIGQFASVEITSSPGSARMASAVARLEPGSSGATAFYTEHIEADAVHEQLVRRGVVGNLLAREPELAADVVFGINVDALLEDRLADHMIQAWAAGRSSLLRPLPDRPLPDGPN